MPEIAIEHAHLFFATAIAMSDELSPAKVAAFERRRHTDALRVIAEDARQECFQHAIDAQRPRFIDYFTAFKRQPRYRLAATMQIALAKVQPGETSFLDDQADAQANPGRR